MQPYPRPSPAQSVHSTPVCLMFLMLKQQSKQKLNFRFWILTISAAMQCSMTQLNVAEQCRGQAWYSVMPGVSPMSKPHSAVGCVTFRSIGVKLIFILYYHFMKSIWIRVYVLWNYTVECIAVKQLEPMSHYLSRYLQTRTQRRQD